jgi:hypothetical protein
MSPERELVPLEYPVDLWLTDQPRRAKNAAWLPVDEEERENASI